ncbi:MAG: N-6 DNA methylase [Actinomycetia bacterium]|nr:N-6 DNA methylase [Actinomycetes bacterium]
MSDPVESYFSELRDIHNSGAGVAETSYYGPLAALLSAVGAKLKPKVTAIINLRNTGAGIPDGGLFTANQLKNTDPGADLLLGQLPARGAIEVKGTSDDVFAVAGSEQVARYVDRYGLVLVTNLRDFALVGRNPDGVGVRTLETCSLAKSETVFWGMAQQPRKYAESAGEGLTEFLRRVLLHNAPLSDPKDLAWFLASYARTARLRLEQKHELPALDALRSQLEDALGLKFEGERGDHFFRSTLVQTLFYGMFASWVLWARDMDHTEAIPWDRRFQWETATATLHVPMVYELFRQFADVRQLGALGISEVLEWAEEILWRVDRKAFFEKFREEHAVQYFYEPFLEAFDPELRKELGVWYTPDEVVKYMVARVDWALREELGIADGLADPSVVVLDPCCGTGAYLVEVLRKIDETLQAKGADALTRQDVKRAAMERVIGFEIMPAPFVVAHLQLGILLAELGVPLRDADERAAIYLTNALTGWNRDVTPPKEKRGVVGQLHSTLLFPEFAEERDAADRIKREEQILVVIGNPPYNSYAGTSPADEDGLVDAYKQGLARDWGVKKFNLDDLYVRFFRLAERQITERTGSGVVCFISNFSWTGDASYVVMRKRFLEEFDSIWVDSLNGDSRETGKLTPEGAPDPSIFSTDRNREGIRVGTAITLMARRAQRRSKPDVRFRDFWGATKRADLVASLGEPKPESAYSSVTPTPESRYSLRPSSVAAHYLEWPKLTDLCAVAPINGLMEKRGGALFDIDADRLEKRMRAYFDPTVEWAELEAMGTGLTRDAARFDARASRSKVLAAESYRPGRLVRYAVRPLEDRWAYFTGVRPLWNEPRPALFAQIGERNAFLYSRPACVASPEGLPLAFTAALGDNDALRGHAYYFSFMLPPSSDGQLDLGTGEATANLSATAQRYVSEIGLSGSDERTQAGLVWQHALAISYSLEYLQQNTDGVKRDWLRIPLPSDPDTLKSSAALGATVAKLLDPRASEFVSPHELPHMRDLGGLSSASGTLNPAVDLAVTARWAIAGQKGVTMPSTGKVAERGYAADELASIAAHAESLGMSTEQAISLLGETCFDVYLNDVAYWRCVPANVWRYTIGGYQVIKKWLSYRERALLGRDLKPEEARYFTEMVRRIAALVLMQPELDANYERVKADVWEWGT